MLLKICFKCANCFSHQFNVFQAVVLREVTNVIHVIFCDIILKMMFFYYLNYDYTAISFEQPIDPLCQKLIFSNIFQWKKSLCVLVVKWLSFFEMSQKCNATNGRFNQQKQIQICLKPLNNNFAMKIDIFCINYIWNVCYFAAKYIPQTSLFCLKTR